MERFDEFLATIENPQHRSRVAEVLDWVSGKFPDLVQRIAWSQPMFTDHGTYIIGFSVSRNHMAVAPEHAAVERFCEDAAAAGYDCTQELIRIPWDCPVDYSLLERIIAFNIEDKAGCTSFWRK